MTNPMIERAGNAVMAAFARQNEGSLVGEGGDITDPQDIVRAVLLAIREPDDAMALAGGALTYPGPYSDGCDDAIGVWQAMIDVALGDG